MLRKCIYGRWDGIQFGIYEEPERKPVRATVKREVYKRAKGKCECCGIKLAPSEGDFHHIRAPSICPTARTVQFLCPACHRRYGHSRKTVTHYGFFEDEKETTIKRKRVPTKRKTTIKRKPAKKKTTTRRKTTTRKRHPTKKKTISRKKRTSKKR